MNPLRPVTCPQPSPLIFRLPSLSLLTLLLALAYSPALAQKSASGAKSQQKLPSADKVVADFVKAVGGKKRLAANRDAT